MAISPEPETFFKKCTPGYATDLAHCGSVTLCSAIVPSPDELDTMFGNGDSEFYVMGALFATQMDLAFAGVKQTPLQKFLAANRVNMSRQMQVDNMGNGLQRIRPYVLARRHAPINNFLWRAKDGVVNGGNWQFDMVSLTDIPSDIRWFQLGETFHVRGVAADGTAVDADYVIAAVPTIVGGEIRVVATKLTSPYQSAAAQANLTDGIVTRGVANKDPVEDYCAEPPGLLNTQLDPFWFQWSRYTKCTDENWEKYKALIRANNPLYSTFYDLPSVEFNRQVLSDWQDRFANTAFWQPPLANQSINTLELLGNIDAVSLQGTTCQGKRANSIGWFQQHLQAGRVFDLQGQPLQIMRLAASLYKMMLLREATGAPAPTEFDLFMPSTFLPKFQQAMLQYYKARGEDMLRLNLDLKVGVLQQSPMGFKFRKFWLDWPDVWINVVTDRYFDTYLDFAKRMGVLTADAKWNALGNEIWIIDWSRNYVGIVGSKRTSTTTATAAELAAVNNSYRCVQEVPRQTTEINSVGFGAISENPQNDLILRNFSNDVPDPATGEGLDYDGVCIEDVA